MVVDENLSDPLSLRASDVIPEHRPEGRLLGDSAAKLLADVVVMISSLIAGIVIARALGPTGKGIYATLALLIAICGSTALLGLGEAMIVVIGRRQATPQEAVSTSLAVAIISGFVGAGICAAVAAVLLGTRGVFPAILLGALTVPIIGFSNLFGCALNAFHKIRTTSLGLVIMSASTTLAVLAFVQFLNMEVLGAVLASTLGSSIGMALFGSLVTRTGLSLRPSLAFSVLKSELRIGLVLEAARLLQAMSARFDLILVYAILDGEEAGYYSVALTLAVLVATVPQAVSYASFPRYSRLSSEQARDLLVEATRLAATAATLTAVAIMLASPFVIPLLFGQDFRPAVPATIIAAIGGVFYGIQWSVSRGRGARGSPGSMVTSFGTSTAVMLILDLFLIPRWGIAGAAAAGTFASAIGAAVVMIGTSNEERLRPADILPRPADVRTLVRLTRRLSSRR